MGRDGEDRAEGRGPQYQEDRRTASPLRWAVILDPMLAAPFSAVCEIATSHTHHWLLGFLFGAAPFFLVLIICAVFGRLNVAHSTWLRWTARCWLSLSGLCAIVLLFLFWGSTFAVCGANKAALAPLWVLSGIEFIFIVIVGRQLLLTSLGLLQSWRSFSEESTKALRSEARYKVTTDFLEWQKNYLEWKRGGKK